MLEEVRSLFAGRPGYREEEGSPFDGFFASAEQLYVIVQMQDEEHLLAAWEKTAEEVAVTVQSRLSGPWDDLRWDLYLLFLVDGQVSAGGRKRIENSRRFCRKLVLTAEDRPFAGRLPLFLELQAPEGVLFTEGDFLRELRNCLPDRAVRRLGERFFAAGAASADELASRLIGGGDDADSGA